MNAPLDVLFDKDIGSRFNFNFLAQDTQDRLRLAQDALITQLEADARNAVDAIVTAGVARGMDAADIVDDVREMIGLTDRLATAVMNYRRLLQQLDPQALTRGLRDESFDDAVRDAIESGMSLSEAKIDEMVSAYADRALTYRAKTIAQTESVRYSNAGLQDSYRQAVARGNLPADAVRQYWQVALDEKTCPICLSIPDLNPDGVPIGEDFDSIDGPQGAPPDPHPNCRCSLEIVTDLDKVPDDEDDGDEDE